MNNDTFKVQEFYEYEDDYLDDEYLGYDYVDDDPDELDPAWHRADQRWDIPWFQSWLVLLVLIVVYLSITGLIYWIEPGIR